MPKIHVIGLGPGSWAGVPVGSLELLGAGLPVFLRTAMHPVVPELRRRGLKFRALDDHYEQGETFAQVYARIARTLLDEAKRAGGLVYAVPGHPGVAEQSVRNLLAAAPGEGVEVVLGPGQSFLDGVLSALGVDPIDGLLMLDATVLRSDQLQPRCHTLIAQVFQRAVASDVKLTLMEVYPDDHPVTLLRAAGVPGEERMERMPLYEIDRVDWVDHVTTLYVPPAEPGDEALRRDPWYLAGLVRRLREPGGCPWDREQTHRSLRRYVIEEAYEVADAIDQDDPDALADELGDLLLQVLLHAQIGAEEGAFALRDVYAALADKLIRRHPHVFGDGTAKDEAEAERMWRTAKAREHAGEDEDGSALARLKWARPPAQVAVQAGRLAAEAGFDWRRAEDIVDKIEEEAAELREELVRGDRDRLEEEFGDLLFAAANLARRCDLDMDRALLQATRKFAARFRQMERIAAADGVKLADLPDDRLDALWRRAKAGAPGRGNSSFGARR
ncbi:nucleoside triphosphate pyrophosphohydrolase [Alicyclobacillus macrosporangiidus]|jgi:tetrapyrrole methylase family protein/MazG family protein|uniref:Tetrapyrrole methylase family protein / MazG family protein n=1 Tax=Alicyclobacillus macrosporangiidus TaxID=392015 RepID=A0A1I7KQT3_9BACL|nr:nucleoside triphosphate pyrophosphohydrolase [Alicyclobacillus macrosporangiidus]SFU99775.1 tetrapyrrole methylase family protein / MazG family protein [Alicyclobacillus macrosporangiidus]